MEENFSTREDTSKGRYWSSLHKCQGHFNFVGGAYEYCTSWTQCLGKTHWWNQGEICAQETSKSGKESYKKEYEKKG